MKTKLLLSFSILFLLLSCNSNTVYSELNKDFESNRWEKNNTKTYVFTIDDTANKYNLKLKFNHIYDYQFSSIPLLIIITSPDNKEEKILYELKIKDSSGKQLADCTGDVCDLIIPFKENTKLQKGNYKITLTNKFDRPYLPNIIGIGIEVDSVK